MKQQCLHKKPLNDRQDRVHVRCAYTNRPLGGKPDDAGGDKARMSISITCNAGAEAWIWVCGCQQPVPADEQMLVCAVEMCVLSGSVWWDVAL